VVVCGYGRNGRQAVQKLREHQQDFVVVETNSELIDFDQNTILFYHGDAKDESTLDAAGIAKARCLISCLPDDSDNLFVVLSARQKNAKIKIISRASNESSVSKLQLAGADHVVMPDKIGGGYMASLLLSPDLIHFVGQLSNFEVSQTHLEELSVSQLSQNFLNQSIRDLKIIEKTGCTVIGYKSDETDYVINPSSEAILTASTKLMLLGQKSQIQKFNQLFLTNK
jgi:voltage-gated potassium channel